MGGTDGTGSPGCGGRGRLPAPNATEREMPTGSPLKLNCPLSYDILCAGGICMDELALKELMLRENEDFRKFHEEHQECEKRLEILQMKSFLSEKEKVEERELKKRKLVLKDKMYLMMAEFRKKL
jgi:uncharacterized protein YdcH (DUF465 family)